MALDFVVDKARCTKCGTCVSDCPSLIISLESGVPAIRAEKEGKCIRCQHCLAVCPTGAISILGKNPAMSAQVKGRFPDTDKMEALIKGRRSVRRYVDENLPPDLIQRLLDVTSHAPTGCNSRQVFFSVVDDRAVMSKIRNELHEIIEARAQADQLPPDLKFFADFVPLWRDKNIDAIFRRAPHMLVVSAPTAVATPEQDCIIALTQFELFAQSMGLGTLWCGLATWAFTDIAPKFKARLGIPEDHQIGYVMLFGKPAVTYHRAVQHAPAGIHYVK